mmetsp:Transcript_16322/g.31673  ORF Transcript_16322/g.31673 Transcript_16322/m.31673 type:complete len:121 (+) Transcript_16322:61-423(+)
MSSSIEAETPTVVVENPPKAPISDEEKAVQIGTNVNCVEHLDALMYCYSPANQVSTYYQRGTVDDCQHMQSNLWKCLKLKTHRDLKEKEDLLREITATSNHSPTQEIWEFKDDPSATWRA